MSEEINRGFEAERLLNEPLFIESVGKVRDGLVNAMTVSPVGDEKTHHQLVVALQLLDKIVKNIKEVATTGKLKEIQLEEESKLKKFARRFA